MQQEYQVSSVDQTWAVAREFAAALAPGTVVALSGDLGAGKTTFTQGLAVALGAKRAVTSPTFCLVVEHPVDKFLLVHMDLYRLHSPEEVLDLGWEEYLARGAVIFVEWPDRAGELIPADAWHVTLELCDDEDARIIRFRRGA